MTPIKMHSIPVTGQSAEGITYKKLGDHEEDTFMLFTAPAAADTEKLLNAAKSFGYGYAVVVHRDCPELDSFLQAGGFVVVFGEEVVARARFGGAGVRQFDSIFGG